MHEGGWLSVSLTLTMLFCVYMCVSPSVLKHFSMRLKQLYGDEGMCTHPPVTFTIIYPYALILSNQVPLVFDSAQCFRAALSRLEVVMEALFSFHMDSNTQ